MADKKTNISTRNDDLTLPDDDKRKEENGAHEHKEGPLVDTTARVLARIRPLKMLWPGQAPDDGKTSASPGGAIEDPRRIVRQGLLIVFLFFGVLGVWATFGEISGAVVGVGTITACGAKKHSRVNRRASPTENTRLT